MSLFKSKITEAVNAVEAPLVRIPQGLAGDDVLAMSSALAAEAHPFGMVRPFLPHQAASYLYALDSFDRWGGAFLGDDMGLGKTQVMQALAADAIRMHGGPALVIAPKVAKAGHIGDLQAAYPNLRFAHLQGHKPPRDAAGNVILPDADILFITDDALTMKAWLTDTIKVTKKVKGEDKLVDEIVANSVVRNAAIVIRDEIHRDKGNMGKPTLRSKVMLAAGEAMRAAGRHIVGATGTLLTNRPVEAFLPLQIVGGEDLVKALTPGSNSLIGFLYRYCNPTKVWTGTREVTNFGGVDGSRLAQLHEYLRRTVYTRREKSDLGTALPHSGWLIVPLALNGMLARYRRIERDFLNMVLEEKGPEAYFRAARAQAIVQMQAMWAEAGVAKAAATVEYVTELVEQDRQVVLFYYHDDVYKALLKGLDAEGISNVTISGKTSQDREQAIATFQAGDAKVMIAQIKAAGMAVTLTAAADAVFCQVPWSAGDLKQAADRILRVDDRTRARAASGEQITWHVLQAAHEDGKPTFDAAMWSVLENKAKVCDAVNAGRDITMPEDSLMLQALQAWFPTVTGD